MNLPILILLAVLAGAGAPAAIAAAGQPETCAQIRAQIGVPPLADHDLLRKMAARTDCAFSSGDFYKAAYGDQPPRREATDARRLHDDDDD
ncbi:MAG: hypothetical protein PHY45_01330 [Rhodocyclaceae bacterium]|nr:hypothetical protein [Rhodocyclaceae bacterium]